MKQGSITIPRSLAIVTFQKPFEFISNRLSIALDVRSLLERVARARVRRLDKVDCAAHDGVVTSGGFGLLQRFGCSIIAPLVDKLGTRVLTGQE